MLLSSLSNTVPKLIKYYLLVASVFLHSYIKSAYTCIIHAGIRIGCSQFLLPARSTKSFIGCAKLCASLAPPFRAIKWKRERQQQQQKAIERKINLLKILISICLISDGVLFEHNSLTFNIVDGNVTTVHAN